RPAWHRRRILILSSHSPVALIGSAQGCSTEGKETSAGFLPGTNFLMKGGEQSAVSFQRYSKNIRRDGVPQKLKMAVQTDGHPWC
ncbi:MAG: hypothetical protein WAM39_03165, partial [Bryobacteraceae bacterium]